MKARIISPKPLSKKSWFNKTDFFECKQVGANLFVLFDGKHNQGKWFLPTELEFQK